MKTDSSELTQPCLPAENQTYTLNLPSQEIYLIARYTVLNKKSSYSKDKHSASQEPYDKNDKLDNSGKIQERIRLAAKGIRPPVMGQLSSSKVLQELRQGGRTKKGVFFLCC